MKLNLKILIVSIVLLNCASTYLTAGEYPKELKAYRGTTPKLDGIISPGEYTDAIEYFGPFDWNREFGPSSDTLELSMKYWVKHDGKNLYFAFDVTDDVIYGIDIPRWLFQNIQNLHDFSYDSWPWGGDGIELFMNPANKWNVTKDDWPLGNGSGWAMECSAHKSYQYKLEKGGLIDGNPRNEYAWTNYRKWVDDGSMEAAVRIKPKSEGRGFVFEWKIAANPCLEVEEGVFWSPKRGITKMGLNIELQDTDEEKVGSGNFGNMSHVDVWADAKGKMNMRNWGTLILYPGWKPKK